jgi:hypothetical protein
MPPNRPKGRGGGGACPSRLPSGSPAKGHRGRLSTTFKLPVHQEGFPAIAPMKRSYQAISALWFSVWFPSLHAQEITTKWDVEIPEVIADGTRSELAVKPEPVDFKVLSSRTTRMQVSESSEMSDLPPIRGPINITVQLVEDPNLPDLPPPLPALPPDDPAVIARLAELQEKHRSSELVFLSATVDEHKRTLLRVYLNGRDEGSITAWSNLDFHHFCGLSSYWVKDAQDGSIHDFSFLMGIGTAETGQLETLAESKESPDAARKISQLPELATSGPAFILVEGDAKSPAMDTLEQLHDLYRKEGTRMEAAHHTREKAHAERKAYLLANPPKPQDVTIQFWKRNNPSPSGAQALEGGAP